MLSRAASFDAAALSGVAAHMPPHAAPSLQGSRPSSADDDGQQGQDADELPEQLPVHVSSSADNPSDVPPDVGNTSLQPVRATTADPDAAPYAAHASSSSNGQTVMWDVSQPDAAAAANAEGGNGTVLAQRDSAVHAVELASVRSKGEKSTKSWVERRNEHTLASGIAHGVTGQDPDDTSAKPDEHGSRLDGTAAISGCLLGAIGPGAGDDASMQAEGSSHNDTDWCQDAASPPATAAVSIQPLDSGGSCGLRAAVIALRLALGQQSTELQRVKDQVNGMLALSGLQQSGVGVGQGQEPRVFNSAGEGEPVESHMNDARGAAAVSGQQSRDPSSPAHVAAVKPESMQADLLNHRLMVQDILGPLTGHMYGLHMQMLALQKSVGRLEDMAGPGEECCDSEASHYRPLVLTPRAAKLFRGSLRTQQPAAHSAWLPLVSKKVRRPAIVR